MPPLHSTTDTRFIHTVRPGLPRGRRRGRWPSSSDKSLAQRRSALRAGRWLMRIAHFETGGILGIAVDEGSGWHGLTQRDGGFPGALPELIAQGADLLRAGRTLGQAPAIDLNAVRLLPPVPVPPKILCVGLNYD